jgi:hypothetical protein
MVNPLVLGLRHYLRPPLCHARSGIKGKVGTRKLPSEIALSKMADTRGKNTQSPIKL